MDAATRLQYLEAMGIDVWVSRHQPIAVLQTSENAEYAIETGARSVVDVSAAQERQAKPVFTALDSAIVTSEASEQAELHREPPTTETASSASFAVHHPAPSVRDSEQVWTELKNEVAVCRACRLCETRTQTVFGVGNRHADWMLIGEAPGQNEDLQGEPFVGRAGQLLTEMLRAIGLKREQVFIANMLKCRPPNNRDPQADEVAACHDFLLRQIELVQPKIIVAVGRIAAQNLLKTQQSLAKLRGVQHRLENYPLVVVHHPAYLLRSLTEKAKAWEDLQFAMSLYQSLKQ